MKISVLMDISVFGFYGYISEYFYINIGDEKLFKIKNILKLYIKIILKA